MTLGARDVEVRSAIAHLRRELGEVERRERRLLALYLDRDLASLSGLKDESDALAKRKVGLHERLAAAEAAVAALHEQAGTRAAIVRACQAALRGLDRLDHEGRRGLLRLLIDEAVILGDTVEIHGFLPTTAPLGPPSPAIRDAPRCRLLRGVGDISVTPASAGRCRMAAGWLVVLGTLPPSGSRGRPAGGCFQRERGAIIRRRKEHTVRIVEAQGPSSRP